MLWNSSAIKPRHEVVVPGDTMARMCVNAVRMRGDTVWLRQKEFGIWQSTTWREFGDAVRDVTLGLAALGFEAGECASILANTCREWMFADFGVLCAGGVTNGVYPTDAPAQVEYLLADSDSVCVFVEDEEQLDKVLAVRARLPKLRKIIVFDTEGLARFADTQVMSLDALRDLGARHAKTDAAEFDRRVESRNADDVAVLIYTSGTTGKPKGAMLTHRNLVYTVHGLNLIIAQDERDERMAFLPLCHVAERVGGSFFGLYTGTRLNFVENPDTVPENVREIAPTVFTAVPRVWEKFYSAVTIALAEATRLQRFVYRWSIAVGEQVADRFVAGSPISPALRLQYRVARKLALDNVRRMIGIDRARFLVTGAAPISPDLVRWYLALGVPMCEVWGQTECCGAATATPATRIKPGKIGPAAPYNEVKVDARGELLIRGANVFKGYHKQPDKTAETIDAEGWLRTGDVGEVDGEGYFRITDRMRDIIITAGGKNITPSEIENELKFSPFITDAVVIGDRRPYLTALVMIDQDNVEQYAQDHSVPFSNYASLTHAREVIELIQAEVDRVNLKFARVEQIKHFRLLETRLTAEDEELTPTMKLKRSLVHRKYGALIDEMYVRG
jgi:long-chain acyl-CoA synthetase